MRRVDFTEVGMENFGPYLDPMILTFQNDTMVLMTGPNGIGKTMSLDAIPFTFYGVTSRGAKGDDLVNNIAGKDCKTWVKFNIDSDNYIATRYQKYTGIGNTVILNKNNVDIKKGHKEVLPEIVRLICSRRAFVNTLMFGQKVKDFFTDLIDSDKKMIFRELLTLELYQIYYNKVVELLKTVKKELDAIEKQQGINAGLTEDSNHQIEILLEAKKRYETELLDTIAEIKKSINTNKRLLEVWEESYKTLENQDSNVDETIAALAEIESHLNSIQTELETEFKSIEQRKSNKLLELKSHADDAKKNINSKYRVEYDRIIKEKEELKETLNDLISTAQRRRHKVELKINDVYSDIRNWKERTDEIQTNVIDAGIAECPLCEQKVSEQTTLMLQQKVNKFNVDIDKANQTIASLKEKIQTLNTEMIRGSEELNKFIDDLTSENSELKKRETLELQQVDLRLIDANSKVSELVSNEKEQKEIAIQKAKQELESSKETLQKKKTEQEKVVKELNSTSIKIENMKNDINRAEVQITQKEKDEYDKTQINSYQKRLLDLEKESKQLESNWAVLSRKADVLEFWKIGFSSSGIPSMLIDEAIPFMNEKVSYYLDKFTNGRYIVSFDTLASTKAGEFRDKISVNVVDTYTRANSRVQLSGGQTRLIDIATILTLGDLQESIQDVSINILLFDEIFDSLDEENIGYVSRVLSDLKFGKSIYLISHRHEGQLEADETLTLH